MGSVVSYVRNNATRLSKAQKITVTASCRGREAVRMSGDGFALVAKAENSKGIHNMLSAIHLKKDIEAFCLVDKNGMKFTVESNGALQAHVYLKQHLFSHYKCTERQQFGINLTKLLECLNVFGTTGNNYIGLTIKYAGEGRPLLMEMVDSGMQSMSGVSTIDSGEPSDFLWDESPLVNRIILQAQALKDALSELDWWGPVLILEMATSGSPTMRMTSKGDQGTCTMELSGGCECFDDTSCTEDTCEEYRFSLLQGVLKALHFADKACLRVNRNGMLSVQLMIRDDTAEPTFVEFLVCADMTDGEWGDGSVQTG